MRRSTHYRRRTSAARGLRPAPAEAQELRRSGAAGANTLAFSGRLGRRALKRGSYRLYLNAVDTAGARGSTKPIRFTIVRR